MIKLATNVLLCLQISILSCKRDPYVLYQRQPAEIFAHRQPILSRADPRERSSLSSGPSPEAMAFQTEVVSSTEPVLVADRREGISALGTTTSGLVTSRIMKAKAVLSPIEPYASHKGKDMKIAKPSLRERIITKIVERKLAKIRKVSFGKSAEKDPMTDLTSFQMAGIVVGGLGLLLLLFVSILIGLVFMIAGVLMLLLRNSVGRGLNTGSGRAPVEVIYLKNGSIIRGSIIEQIPNESLKIRTADGSVFVYKMSEVFKITKEEH